MGTNVNQVVSDTLLRITRRTLVLPAAAMAVPLVVVWGCGGSTRAGSPGPQPTALATASSQIRVTETSTAAADSPTSAAAPTLEVTSATSARTFTLQDLVGLERTEGYGGFTCPPHPGITGPTQYSDVALSDPLESVGGLSPGRRRVPSAPRGGWPFVLSDGRRDSADPGTRA